jgi:inactive dipeptidyl peptidase 10
MPVRLKDLPKSQRTRMQHAEWLGNTTALIIIIDNDIYLRQSPSDEEDIRLTHTGVPGLIYNGITDWLYQGMHLSPSNANNGNFYKFFNFLLVQRKF